MGPLLFQQKLSKISFPKIPPAGCQHFVLGKATTLGLSFVETNSRMILKYIKNIKIGEVIIQPSVFCLSKFSVGRNEVSFWSSWSTIFFCEADSSCLNRKEEKKTNFNLIYKNILVFNHLVNFFKKDQLVTFKLLKLTSTSFQASVVITWLLINWEN